MKKDSKKHSKILLFTLLAFSVSILLFAFQPIERTFHRITVTSGLHGGTCIYGKNADGVDVQIVVCDTTKVLVTEDGNEYRVTAYPDDGYRGKITYQGSTFTSNSVSAIAYDDKFYEVNFELIP